ncbi:MAG TPA: DUF4956 domain-containing protein [Crocinitomix sp.]|nr:DUF4956 domain-containing protein [Crocinitomix sp.]
MLHFTSILAQIQNTANNITNTNFLGVQLMDDDFYKLLFRFIFNLIIITIVIRLIYYVKTPRRNYVFTFYLISIISFVIVFALKKLDIDTGMGLGLFAIFGIIRYRTNPLRVREMTYLFITIGLSVVNGLSGKQVSYAELFFINFAVVLIVYLLDTKLLINLESSKIIVYEKIENIKPENYALLIEDLKQRTGIKINRAEVGKVDFLKDIAEVKIFYNSDEEDINLLEND